MKNASAVSPELSKRRVAAAGDFVFVQDMSRSLLCASALGNKQGVRMPDLTPGKEFVREVKILDRVPGSEGLDVKPPNHPPFNVYLFPSFLSSGHDIINYFYLI